LVNEIEDDETKELEEYKNAKEYIESSSVLLEQS
jgi:hypothetical protein